jgi:hypothetical protein
VGNQIAALQKLYQADSPFNLSAPNPKYIGTLLQQGLGFAGAFNPNYRTPRSVEMNVGLQREIRPGIILSADFVRNLQTHYFLGVDENHTGDVHYFNRAAALQAISATNRLFSCGSGTDFGSIQCAIRAGAQITDYAKNGLTTSADFGAVCSFPSTAVPGSNYPRAFPGINPMAPPMNFSMPIGRSVYNGLQTKLRQSVQNPFRGVRAGDLQVSYLLSRFENSGGSNGSGAISAIASDQDFGVGASTMKGPTAISDPRCWIELTSFRSVAMQICRAGRN